MRLVKSCNVRIASVAKFRHAWELTCAGLCIYPISVVKWQNTVTLIDQYVYWI